MVNKSKLTFSALGGLEEIGVNSYCYSFFNGNARSSILVDLGLGFKEYSHKFIDNFIPDISYVLSNKKRFKGIVFTHAHEDHIGAIEYLYNDIKDIPIYTTKFTADVIRNKLLRRGIKRANIHVLEVGREYEIGDFNITLIEVNHSTPSNTMILIKTNDINVFHSGDFKIDGSRDIVLPKKFPKIDYLFCDSTNVFHKEVSKGEKTIIKDIDEIVKKATKSVWVTLFSSNVERLNNILKIAEKNKKKIVLLGASVNNYYNIGSKNNYIQKTSNVIAESEIRNYKENELLFIVTGSQGEERSFLAMSLRQGFRNLKIKEGDTVIFSSKIIPGNELNIFYILNSIADIGAKIYTSDNYNIHVSGHPSQVELKKLYKLVKPNFIIPMHGEALHIKKHTDFAKSLGYKSDNYKNGDIVELKKEGPVLIDKINISKFTQEGGRIIPAEDNMFKERKRALFGGVVNVVINVSGYAIADVKIDIIGILMDSEKNNYITLITKRIKELFESDNINSDNEVKDKVKAMVRRIFLNDLDKKPIVSIYTIYS